MRDREAVMPTRHRPLQRAITIPEPLWQALSTEAERLGISRCDLVRMACAAYVQKLRKEAKR